MVFYQPLDLQYWLVNIVSGGHMIFGLITILVIFGICAYFRLSQIITGGAVLIFLFIMGGWMIALLLIVLVLFGFLLYSAFRRILS